MKKICLIIPRGLPVPALKGGAIETLMNMLADENEKWKKINLTIVSTYDKEAKKSSKIIKTLILFTSKEILIIFYCL